MISTLWKTCAICAIFTLLTSLRSQPRRRSPRRAVHGREMSSVNELSERQEIPWRGEHYARLLLTI